MPHIYPTQDVQAHLSCEQSANQTTDIIMTVAIQIYETGALYRALGPDSYEVTSPDNSATIMSAHQFYSVLSLVRSMKSTTALALY